VKECPLPKTGLYGIDQFTYVPEQNCYICPEGKTLNYVGINALNRTHLYYFDAEALRRLLTEEPLHARQVSGVTLTLHLVQKTGLVKGEHPNRL
jgi:hypothetical protein